MSEAAPGLCIPRCTAIFGVKVVASATAVVLAATVLPKMIRSLCSSWCYPIRYCYTTRPPCVPNYQPYTMSIAFVTVSDDKIARKLSGMLVKEKLAACVNIIPGVKSIYEWEGCIEQDSELILMIKTRTSHIDALSQFIREHHPYDVAEVISTPIENGNAPYMKWMADVIPENCCRPCVTPCPPVCGPPPCPPPRCASPCPPPRCASPCPPPCPPGYQPCCTPTRPCYQPNCTYCCD